MPQPPDANDRREGRIFRILFSVAVIGALIAIAVALTSVIGDDEAEEQTSAAERSEPRADTDAEEPGEERASKGEESEVVTAPDAEAPQRLWFDRGERAVAVRKGERIKVYEKRGGKPVERAGPKTEFGSVRTFSVLGRRGEWLKVTSEIAEDNRPLWIEADTDRLKFFTTRLSIHASLSDRRVDLRRGEKVLESFPVTVGAAGSSTPEGRFAVTDLIVGGLNPVYGCCAIALTARQEDLPPGWIGGDRVAIHGTTGPVGTAASSGCIRARDDDVSSLVERVPLGTPVFISD